MSKDFWESINKDNAGDAILTGYVGKLKDMPVYEYVSSLMGSGEYVLDFGCGVGRNSVELAKSYKNVIAFDLPNMIDLVPEENKLKNIQYINDWEKVKEFKFDLSLGSLVFQHIDATELDEYLNDLYKLTNSLIVHSRTWIDHSNLEVLPILEKYFILDSIEYSRDPNSPSDDHFVAVLKSKEQNA